MRYSICAALMLLALSSSTLESIAQEPTAQEPTAQPSQPAPATEAPATEAPANEASATEAAASEESAPASKTAADLAAEEARLNDLLSLVKDNTLQIHKRENPAYFGLLKKVLDRSVDQLNGEVALNPKFNELYSNPEKYRGQLVRLELNVRRIISIPVKVSNAANLTEV